VKNLGNQIILDARVQLPGKRFDPIRVGQRKRPRAGLHNQRLQVLGAHDGAHAAPAEGMMGFVEDAGKGNSVFTGRTDDQGR
jgi:hypothetical protein